MASKKRVLLLRIHIRNFLSFGDNWSVIDLNQSGLNLILGDNRDIDDNGSRNGCGKTATIQAISVALFNTPITKIKVGDLINSTNRKNMEIKLEFVTEWNSNEYMVHVGQKPDFVHLYDVTNGNKDIAHATKSEVTKQISELIGVDSKVARFIMLFSASNAAFLDESAPKQREIIESLFDMDVISNKAKAVADLKKEYKKQLDYEQYKLKTIADSNARAEKLIATAKRAVADWDRTNASDLKVLQSTLATIADIDQQTLDDEECLLQTIREKTSIAQELKLASSKISNEINTAKSVIRGIQTKIDAANADVVQCDAKITHLKNDNCPYCNQSMPNAVDNLTLVQASRDALSSEIKVFDKQLDDANAALAVIQSSLDDAQLLIINNKKEQTELEKQRNHDDVNHLRKLLTEKDNIITRITELQSAQNPHHSHLAELENTAVAEIDDTARSNAKSDLDHADFLLKLLNNKNSFIRQRIIGKVIPYLNTRLNSYTKRLGLPHTVTFENDLGASIRERDRKLSFANLSTGERHRVNLALSFAFRDVLSTMHSEINTLFLDEVLDTGLDEAGVFNTVELLTAFVQESDVCLYMITHRPEIASMADRTIHVIKEGGFTRIEHD